MTDEREGRLSNDSRWQLSILELTLESQSFPLENFRLVEGNPIIAGIHREMARRGPHAGAIKDSLMLSKMLPLKGDLVPSNSGR